MIFAVFDPSPLTVCSFRFFTYMIFINELVDSCKKQYLSSDDAKTSCHIKAVADKDTLLTPKHTAVRGFASCEPLQAKSTEGSAYKNVCEKCIIKIKNIVIFYSFPGG